MNILELLAKNHPQVDLQRWDGATHAWATIEGGKDRITKVSLPRLRWPFWGQKHLLNLVRGVRLEPGTRLVVRQASHFWPAFAAGDGVLYLRSLNNAPGAIRLTWSDGGKALKQHDVSVGATLREIHVPAVRQAADLEIEAPAGSKISTFVGIHRLLDRNVLYSLCKGRGVEIGPGPKPQILPGPGVDVSYVEQATPEDWVRLYGKDTKTPVDPSLWKRYVVGNADRVPVEPRSLDFIFSSHVIEHLANPLGHLKYWSSLLRDGGVVAAVIPDMEGCKDFVFQPSTPAELREEFASGDMEVKLRHYERWSAHRAPDRDPADVLASGRSIHVHFYTPASIRSVLESSFRELGFRSSQVISSANHKDFFIVLRK